MSPENTTNGVFYPFLFLFQLTRGEMFFFFLTERSPSLKGIALQGVGNAIEPSLLFTERQQRLTTAILARTFFDDDDMYKECAVVGNVVLGPINHSPMCVKRFSGKLFFFFFSPKLFIRPRGARDRKIGSR